MRTKPGEERERTSAVRSRATAQLKLTSARGPLWLAAVGALLHVGPHRV